MKYTKYTKLFGDRWAKLLLPFLESNEFKNIGKTLKSLNSGVGIVYPGFDDMFNAFKYCPLEELKVVFITTNPYTPKSLITNNTGLAFSAPHKTPVLSKIFAAVEQDVADGLYLTTIPDLTRWAKQGVLLLNLDLSCDTHTTINHRVLWEPFIEYVLRALRSFTGIIYVLIGKDASKYRLSLINESVNDVYELEHPMNAVIHSRPWRYKSIFSDINRISKFINNTEIQWV
jgi:uracil-DNA glycosylase